MLIDITKACTMKFIWRWSVRCQCWKWWRHFQEGWWGWLILCLVLFWDYEVVNCINIRCQIVLHRNLANVDICANESASSNTIGLSTLDLYGAMAMLWMCQMESGHFNCLLGGQMVPGVLVACQHHAGIVIVTVLSLVLQQCYQF